MNGPDGFAGIGRLGTILCAFAHPDDETYLAGGLMALAAGRGQHVQCLTATRGEAGGDGAARAAELAEALAVLGVRRHRFLDLPDGGCADVDPEQPVTALAETLVSLRPDTVVTFGPDGLTGHPDHAAVSAWVTEAVRRAAPSTRVLHGAAVVGERLPAEIGDDVYAPGLPVRVPDDRLALRLDLAGGTLDRKVGALLAQRSQTAAIVERIGIDAYRRWVSVEAFVDAFAEPAATAADASSADPVVLVAGGRR